MIRVKLADGTERMLDEAEVALVWKDADGAKHEYTLAQVRKLVLIEPEILLSPGTMRAMPVVGLAFRDASDLAVEIPMPCPVVLDLAVELPRTVIQAEQMAPGFAPVGELPRGLPKPPGD